MTGGISPAWGRQQEINADPMTRMSLPIVPGKPVPIVPADGRKRLLAACAEGRLGRVPRHRADHAAAG
jgi:hypothetical protein